MSDADITLRLPKSIMVNLGYKEEEVEKVLKQLLALELYKEGKLSLGKATELAGFKNKWHMIFLLNQHQVPINYSAEDVKADLKALEELIK